MHNCHAHALNGGFVYNLHLRNACGRLHVLRHDRYGMNVNMLVHGTDIVQDSTIASIP